MVSNALDCSSCLTRTCTQVVVIYGTIGCFCLGLEMVPKGTLIEGLGVSWRGLNEVVLTK